jgi:hypothetical protein
MAETQKPVLDKKFRKRYKQLFIQIRTQVGLQLDTSFFCDGEKIREVLFMSQLYAIISGVGADGIGL